MSAGPLGWIPPSQRTPEQHQAHARASQHLPAFRMQGQTRLLAEGEKVLLTDFWKQPTVVEQVGFVFPRFHQLTGSCVGAGGGNALFTLIAVQACLATEPTQAIIPWWPYSYGQSRALAGMRGQGEGSLGSTFFEAIRTKGVLRAGILGLPEFQDDDGLVLTSRLEYQWSDGNNVDPKYSEAARSYPLGTGAEVSSLDALELGLVNGYPATWACDMYVGDGSVKGSGEDACVMGRFDGNGGHQTSLHGVWRHRQFGRLFLYLNNWPARTYPKDPAGGPPCSVWLPESEIERSLRQMEVEAYLLSHLTWFPAQPSVLDWLI